ncbi:MAG: DUF6273 domain-containing protein [Mobilitalea sp.]
MITKQLVNGIKRIVFVLFTLLISINFLPFTANHTLFQAQAATQKLKLGSYVKFGKYNGDSILWRVINVNKDGSYLIYSEKILCLKAFDAKGDLAYGLGDSNRETSGSNYWRLSSIREWLNSTDKNVEYSCQIPDADHVDIGNSYDTEAGFLSNFTKAEWAAIKATTHKCILASIDKAVASGGKVDLGADSTKSTLTLLLTKYDSAYYEKVQDYVFLLDQKEISTYITARKWDNTRMPTKKAVDNSTYQDAATLSSTKTLAYWTRSADVATANNIWGVGKNANSSYNGFASLGRIGIVPALTLKSDIKISSGKGNASSPFVVSGSKSATKTSKLAALKESSFTSSVPKYNLAYLLDESSTAQVPVAMNENRIAVGNTNTIHAAYWDASGKMHLFNTKPGDVWESSWTANIINNNNVAISSVGGCVWPTLTSDPVSIQHDINENPDPNVTPIRILDSGVVVGNTSNGMTETSTIVPAYLESINVTKPTFMKVAKGWLPTSLDLPIQPGLQSVASNGAAVGFAYLTKDKPTMYYWSGLSAEPIEVALPDGLDFTEGYFFPVVNSKGQIIANWVTKSGNDPKSYYYKTPKSKPVQLTDVLGAKASKYIYLTGINDKGDIVGTGVNGATIWRNKIPYPLTDLTTMDKTKDQHLSNPVCINNNGDIIVLYDGVYPVQCYAVISLK